MSHKKQLEEQMDFLDRERHKIMCPVEHDVFYSIYHNIQREYRTLTGRYYHPPRDPRQMRLFDDGVEE